jgi:GNAT superfamily N-acetyltransferase
MRILNLKNIINKLSQKNIIDIINLLSQLSTVYNDDYQRDYMITHFKENIKLFSSNINIFIGFIDDDIIALGTLFIEQKIIHDFGKVAHIEDIVINDKFRGMGIGKQLLEFLNTEARNIGCYKSILNCKDELIPFYNKCQPKNSEIKLSNQISFYFN